MSRVEAMPVNWCECEPQRATVASLVGLTAMTGAAGAVRSPVIDQLQTLFGGLVWPGSATAHRRIGLVLQAAGGVALACGYHWLLGRVRTVERGAAAGAGLGVLHGVAAGASMGLVRYVHPLVPDRYPDPGPFMLAHGTRRAVEFVALHVLFGSVVGAFAARRRSGGASHGLRFAPPAGSTHEHSWRTPMAENKETISTLNSLIETCGDGAEGFRVAADGLQDPSIKQQFQRYAQERKQCAEELRAEVRKLGGTPDEGGSMSGAMHRGWINIKSAVTGRSDAAIIAEAERGEDIAVEAYEKALEAGLPAQVQAVVRRQFTTVKAAHDRVRELEKSHTVRK